MVRRLFFAILPIVAVFIALIPHVIAKDLFEVTKISEVGFGEYELIEDQAFFREKRFCRFDLGSEKVIQGDPIGDPNSNTEFVPYNGVILTIDGGYIKALSPVTLRVQWKIALPKRETLGGYIHLAAGNGLFYAAADYSIPPEGDFDEGSVQGILYCYRGKEMLWHFTGAVGESFNEPVPFGDKVVLPGNYLYTLDAQKGNLVSKANQKGEWGIMQAGSILWIPSGGLLVEYDMNTQVLRKTGYRISSKKDLIFAPPYMDANYTILASTYLVFWGGYKWGSSCQLALFNKNEEKLWEKTIPAEVNFQPVIYKDYMFVPVNYLSGSQEGLVLVYDLKGNLVTKLFPHMYAWPGAPLVYQDKLYLVGGGGIFRVKVN